MKLIIFGVKDQTRACKRPIPQRMDLWLHHLKVAHFQTTFKSSNQYSKTKKGIISIIMGENIRVTVEIK